MSSWKEVKAAHSELIVACTGKDDPGEAWARFREIVIKTSDDPPYFIRIILDLLEEKCGSQPREKVQILDHGCGAALMLLYLFVLGYEGIHGVDLDGPSGGFSSIISKQTCEPGRRFFVYDGGKLPFGDDMFDFVFSTQVLEHVRPHLLETYYSEERRVLKPGGVAYHQVPHRLAPYDGHTRTWLIHYFPRPVWLALLRLLKRNPMGAEESIFLRWPWVHRHLLTSYLGGYEDRTMERFLGFRDYDNFDGPKQLRRLLGEVLRLPIIGRIGGKIFANFLMLDTVSTVPQAKAQAMSSATYKPDQ